MDYCTHYHCAGDCGLPHNQKELILMSQNSAEQDPIRLRDALRQFAEFLEPMRFICASVDTKAEELDKLAREILGEDLQDTPTLAHEVEPVVTDYWCDHYLWGACTLCGNSGFIDTRGVATAAGVPVGRVNYCICPNGQAWRAQKVLDLVELDEATLDQVHGNLAALWATK